MRISYRFHPKVGEIVVVVGQQRHGGADHLVIRQPDQTLALLPAWMIEAEAGSHTLCLIPHLPSRRFPICACWSALSYPQGSGTHPDQEEPTMRSERSSQRDLFTIASPPPPLRSEVRSKLGPLLQALLTEAAGHVQRSEPKDLLKARQKGNDDDQDRG